MLLEKLPKYIAVTLGVLCLSGAAQAQTAWTLDLTQDDRGELKPAPGGGLQAGELTADTTLEVRCAAPVDCTQLQAHEAKGSATVMALSPAGAPSARQARFVLRLERWRSERLTGISVSFAGKSARVALSSAPSMPDALTSHGERTPSVPGSQTLGALLGATCDIGVTTGGYDRAGNRAEIVVTPRGMLLTPIPALDEDDTLKVTVIAEERLLRFIDVRRTSPVRSPGGIRIVGEDIQLPRELGLALQTQKDSVCGAASFYIGNLAPGRAELEITVVTDKGPARVGTIELAVSPLYAGMFSLGALWSQVTDPDFGLVSRGEDTVITARDKSDSRLLYALFYTPFVWGVRDIEKTPERWYHHINPTLGLVLNDPLQNALVGASVSVHGVVLTAGVHAARVDVLDANVALSEGDVFLGPEDQLPSARQWKVERFVSVSIDLRAAVKLVGAVLGAARQ